MTVTLTPETEARLTAVATLRGLPPEDTLAELIAEAQAEHEQTVAGDWVSMAEIAAGDWVSLEDMERLRLLNVGLPDVAATPGTSPMRGTTLI